MFLLLYQSDVPSSGSDNVVSHPDRVRVFVRIRPLTKNDVKGRFSKGAVAVGDTKMTQVSLQFSRIAVIAVTIGPFIAGRQIEYKSVQLYFNSINCRWLA